MGNRTACKISMQERPDILHLVVWHVRKESDGVEFNSKKHKLGPPTFS